MSLARTATETTASPRPRSRRRPAIWRKAWQTSRDHGLAIVPDVLTGDALKRTRDALYRAAESDRARGREQKFGLDYDHDDTNQRVWNVLSRDPLVRGPGLPPDGAGLCPRGAGLAGAAGQHLGQHHRPRRRRDGAARRPDLRARSPGPASRKG